MTEKAQEDKTEDIGIPEDMRVKRRYTMSEAALEQRRIAAQKPKPGMEGIRNNWQHGRYAKSFFTRLKPCKSTCTKYPCSLIEENAVEPGGNCLDAEELLDVINAVHAAIKNPKDSEAFKEVAALSIANSVKILEQLQEDIMRDGTVVRSEKYDKEGNLVQVEYKAHPALLALPKMIADLGMNPDNFMMTPKAQAKQTTEEEGVKTIAGLLSQIAGKLSKARAEKDANSPADGVK